MHLFFWPLNRSRLLSDRRRLGRWGEKRCEKYLKKKGFRKLAGNFSCKSGEIDLVMVDGEGTVVFVEVKTRADESFGPAEAVITQGKKMKLTRTGRYFLSSHDIADRACRFDVVVIVVGHDGREEIRHYENVFIP